MPNNFTPTRALTYPWRRLNAGNVSFPNFATGSICFYKLIVDNQQSISLSRKFPRRAITNNKYSNTHCIFLVRLAAPQVADQSLHSLQAHCTVWHVHMVFLYSFSGCSSQVCGSPEQFFWGTTISVVWMDRVLSAIPHVADQSDHAFQVHLTDLHGPKNNSQNNDNVSKMKKILVH